MARARGVLPVVSRPLVMAWLLTFCAVLLELPISQLLYAPGSPPAAIAIEDNLSNYHFGIGMAQAVLAVGLALAAVLAVLGGTGCSPRRAGGGSEGRPVAERISVEELTKVYPGGNQALAGLSLSVAPGSFVVLLGPSGSGKTTLLRCLAGIERITAGRISIGPVTVADVRAHLAPDRRDLSMVFQDYALWPHLTVRDNVAFALRRRKLPRTQVQDRAATMLDRVGLGALASRYPNELSGGEQQRVALARALIADTGLILCDEPLSNLDADLRERMRVEISALVREAAATTIYITHDQAEAFALADRVGVLEQAGWSRRGPGGDLHPARVAVRGPVHRPVR